jgi:acyl carrier protein
VDCLKIVPSHLRAMFAAEGGRVMPRVVVVVGGEATRWEWAREWAEAGGCRVMNHYGPTECTVGALMGEVGEEAKAGGQPGLAPLGRPLGNTEVYVLDKGQAVVPVGVVGELYIGGAGLARGYLNQAELTAAKFVKHPFSGEGARLYRTGDLVRYLSDGRLEFVGRLDSQVKVRGYRVELGEVETVLSRHSGVKECVVVAREEESGDKRLVAYVVAATGVAFTPSELRSYLKEKLPEYMVPSAFVELGELPLTGNGKVDHHALPVPDYEFQKLETAYVAPRTPTEEKVAAIWSEVLRIELVSTDSNFFEIGGHSLLATQVVSRLREACRIELPLRNLFEFPTVAGLSLHIEQMQLVQDYEDPSRLRIDPRITKTIDQLLAELN